MFFNLCKGGVVDPVYRLQLWASISVTFIALSHGIGVGWLSPMLTKLQSPTETPIDFTVNIEESSWIGALISVGGVLGNISFILIFERFGRKVAIYGLALPHICLWLLLYFAQSIEYLYAARICGGLTGGGVYIVLPIFISEISDSSLVLNRGNIPTRIQSSGRVLPSSQYLQLHGDSIEKGLPQMFNRTSNEITKLDPKLSNVRGRLTSMFSLSLNLGILCGFALSSFVPYHIIPLVVLPVPILYLIAATYFPETPHYLLRQGLEIEAQKSFLFYKNLSDNKCSVAKNEVQNQFANLKASITEQHSKSEKVVYQDFLNRKSLMAIGTGIILMVLNIFCGSFALISYMSSIFTATKTELHPDINTIIIGVVQVIGAYTATILVDHYGRKVLMIVSTSGMGIGMAAFGMYAFFAEETDADLSFYSHWLPLLLMAIIIFLANVGIISVTFVVLVEIMPPKIRSIASSVCLALLSLFSFTFLRIFPISMHYFGLSATMWFCATVCAFGLFYISIFLEETKGKSLEN